MNGVFQFSIRCCAAALLAGFYFGIGYLPQVFPSTIVNASFIAFAGSPVVGGLFFLTAASATSFFVRRLFFRGWLERHSGTDTPKLLIDISSALIWVCFAAGALAVVFDFPIGAFLTTSGIVIAVVGFALRNLISDIFTGIALGVERPFKIGDWLEIDEGRTIGKVIEMDWRSTKLLNREEQLIVISNSTLATSMFKNFSAPETFWRDSIELTLDYSITAHQAERILMTAVSEVPASRDVPRKPEVRIKEYTERGVTWELRFWVQSYEEHSSTRYAVQRRILRNLHYSAVHISKTKIEFSNVEALEKPTNKSEENFPFMRGFSLFQSFRDEELEALCENVHERLCLEGTSLVNQGDDGDSLFLVKEGFLSVVVAHQSQPPTTVGHLGPGTFFGEMSLLTGASRQATVIPSVDAIVLEISREAIQPFIENRTDLVQQLSMKLAERQLQNEKAIETTSEETLEEKTSSLTAEFFGKIQHFFGLK